MLKERTARQFQKALAYSRQSRLRRLINNPYRTLSKHVLFRLAERLRLLIPVKKKLFFGEVMNLMLPDPISVFLYNFGFFEEGLTRIVLEYLNQGDVFVDIGAHFGYYTLLGSHLVGQDGAVHAFEPTPSTFSVLQKNSRQSNIFINNTALAEQAAIRDFYDAGLKLSAFNGFFRPDIEGFKNIKQYQVKCVTIDDYFREKNNLPDFIKMDAEGAELKILAGAKNIIQAKHPLITLETGDHGGDLTIDKIQYLTSLGYQPSEYSRGEIKEHQLRDTYGYDNLLFVYKD